MSRPDHEKIKNHLAALSDKELENLTFYCKGLSLKEIAKARVVGEGTVRGQFNAALNKFGIYSRDKMVIYKSLIPYCEELNAPKVEKKPVNVEAKEKPPMPNPEPIPNRELVKQKFIEDLGKDEEPEVVEGEVVDGEYETLEPEPGFFQRYRQGIIGWLIGFLLAAGIALTLIYSGLTTGLVGADPDDGLVQTMTSRLDLADAQADAGLDGWATLIFLSTEDANQHATQMSAVQSQDAGNLATAVKMAAENALAATLAVGTIQAQETQLAQP